MSTEVAAQVVHRPAVCIGLFTASQAAIALGDAESARRQLEEGVVLSQETRDRANLGYFLDAWDDAVDEGRAPEVDDAVRYVLTGSTRTLRLAT